MHFLGKRKRSTRSPPRRDGGTVARCRAFRQRHVGRASVCTRTEEGLSAGTRDERTRTSVVRPRGRTKESAPLTFLQMMLCFQPGGNIFVKNGRRCPGRAIPAVKWSFSSVLCGVTGAGATLRAVAVMGFPFSLFSLFSRHFHLSNAVICSGRTMASSDRSPEDKE